MHVNILTIGDIVGQSGLDILAGKLRTVQKFNNIAFTVINGENAAANGITPGQAEFLLDLGADVITLGNHTWDKRDIIPFLDDCQYILRPSNFAPQVPGRGWGIFETEFGSVCVISLIGRHGLPVGSENPFFEADRILKKLETNIVLVDFHAEATSEKLAMAYYLDGRVSAAWGTHTHVQTSDCRVFHGGMGYITDLGMTGPCESVIGVNPEQPISRFLGNPHTARFEVADGPAKIEGAVFEIDTETGKCVYVEAIRIT
ncbi:MAG: TIGR00282 family metallophosphoesterase [Oscillospiraceae bacterium]|nr:TIGR00282 family metallophosphoesterase [Oscillospiraceae bacterium]